MNEKTVKQAADLLGVTTQTIYRRLKDLDPEGKHQLEIDGIKHITAEGIALIDRRSATAAKDPAADETTLDGITKQLIDTLQAQLLEKDKQIAELSKIASAQATLIAQRQHIDLIAADAKTAKSSNFIQRLKAKFSSKDDGTD